jgi:hypothetical protein
LPLPLLSFFEIVRLQVPYLGAWKSTPESELWQLPLSNDELRAQPKLDDLTVPFQARVSKLGPENLAKEGSFIMILHHVHELPTASGTMITQT